MALVRIKGLNRVRKRLADGSERIYYYAWKGGPQLPGRPGDPEFLAAYNAAVGERRNPKGDSTLRSLVARYRASPEFTLLAGTTKAEWARWLDRISEGGAAPAIGDLPIAALDDRRVRVELLDWRDQWADRPRAADYGWQVLSRVLSWSHGRGILAINAALGVEQLWESDRADQIFTDAEISAFRAAAPNLEVGFILPLACRTGLRRTALATLLESQVGDIAIIKPAGKKRRRGAKARAKAGGAEEARTKLAIVPLLDETRELLAEILAQKKRRYAEACASAARHGRPQPPWPLTVLTNSRCLPWTANGLEHQVVDTKAKAGIDKHLHDARGTFGTFLRKVGKLTAAEIADVLAWEEARVERLLATYVDRDDIIRSIAARLNRNKRDPETPN